MAIHFYPREVLPRSQKNSDVMAGLEEKGDRSTLVRGWGAGEVPLILAPLLGSSGQRLGLCARMDAPHARGVRNYVSAAGKKKAAEFCP
jgi:hypothetical protein